MSALPDSLQDDAPSIPAESDGAGPAGRRQRREQVRRRTARRRASVVGVLGELLLTGGVVVLLFLGWQLWLSELIIGNEMRQESAQQTQEWNDQAAADPTPVEPVPTEEPAPDEPLPEIALNPPVPAVAADAAKFGMLIVPRWGADYYRTIAEGVDAAAVLDRGRLGRYPTTQMPGEVGNFALAAHRMGKGGSLHYVDELRLGDHIYVETAEGWYQYSFRNLEYVRPTGIGVLNPVPQMTVAAQGERFITLTSCNPEHTTSERIIAYGLFDRFYPRDPSAVGNGAPAEIAATVNK
ncbi:class E sortase [Salinibacterium sp. ZJ77]|uniref:class E sortase n=1 Tax=Salinibacterium sp. ZJ77 TaxID=2708337 RepID=UPI00142239F0|nr:class E sortase [Salinibacterium sp. ZJ77]